MNNMNSIANETAVIILAAGKGTRMGEDAAKVCFEIDGVPAINRTLATFKKSGFKKFVLVVGSKAEEVMETVAPLYPDVSFVYQTPQLGTGHAARIASDMLKNGGHNGPILLSMGDKYIEDKAIEVLLDCFIRKQADMALLTIPKNERTQASCGRVIINQETGNVIDILEIVDIARQMIADQISAILLSGQSISSEQIKSIIDENIPKESKQKAAVAEILEFTHSSVDIDKLKTVLELDKYNLTLNNNKCLAQEVEQQCQTINPSFYLAKSDAFYTGIAMIDNNNAQNEYYITDIVSLLSEQKTSKGDNKYKVVAAHIDDDRVIQAFNSPDELLTIQDYIREKSKKKTLDIKRDSEDWLGNNEYCEVSQWLEKLSNPSSSLNKWLSDIYGNLPDLHSEKLKTLCSVLECYGGKFSYDEKVVIVRAPGRVNLMGRHVDHRGGDNNFLAIQCETIAVVGRRKDDKVVAVNTDATNFVSQEFTISELMGQLAWDQWRDFVDSDWVKKLLKTTAGDWGNYIKASLLRLQHHYKDLRLKGLNMALTGDIPIAAGLSSSSTIVVATLKAAITLNGLDLTTGQFIDFCGEGEWFVGSRGGSGDHAAIYLGQKDKIANVSYYPFALKKMVDMPSEYQVVIANSHIKAQKSSTARDMFNSRICSYNLGLEILKKRCPEFGCRLEHLRDLTPENLICKVSSIYKALLKVPSTMTRADIESALGQEYKDVIEMNFSNHNEPDCYNIRGVLLYGIAEILRSQISSAYLETGDIEKFGKMMKVSHDGDRISSLNEQGERIPWELCYDDSTIDGFIRELASEVPERVLAAQLYMQPGQYACSTFEIDEMADIACNVEGVAGAQIAGAGLGGCIMVLVKRDKLGNLRQELTEKYYKPRNLEPIIVGCVTVEGSSVVAF